MADVDDVAPVALRMALDVLPFRVAVLDAEGTIRQVNDRWHDFAVRTTNPIATGAVGDQYLGGLEAAETDAAAAVAAGIQSLLDGEKETVSVECPIEVDDGPRWELFRATALETPEGRSVAIACADISDQKQISADLRLKQRAMDDSYAYSRSITTVPS